MSTLRKALGFTILGALLGSCGGPASDEKAVSLTPGEIEKLVKQRREEAKRILGVTKVAATPIMNLDRIKYREDAQNASAPYPGREAATERLEELDLTELIKRFGRAYAQTKRLMRRGRPYPWDQLDPGSSPAKVLDRVTIAMLERERRDGFKFGREFTKDMVLLRRNSHRVWHAALVHAPDLLERDFGRLTRNCRYFPKEMADSLLGVGVKLDEEDVLAEIEGELGENELLEDIPDPDEEAPTEGESSDESAEVPASK